MLVAPVFSNFSFCFFVGVGCLGLTCISVDGLCPEEGFKGVRVSRSIVVVVLVGFLAERTIGT